jgi:hypothetical protein
MTVLDGPTVFVLGCERCGSTWLSNVLDSSRNVEFFMEPFADYAKFFPGFPGRNLYVNQSDTLLMDILGRGYPRLKKAKYPLFYNRRKKRYWKKVDKIIVDLLGFLCKWSGIGTSLRIKQYELLNLNLKDIPIDFLGGKSERSTLTVIKELRMNFKIALLQAAFTEAKYIIVVRHPGAQVVSIMRLFSRGRLDELRRSLLTLSSHLSSSSRFEKYSDYFQCLESQSDLQGMLLFWWLVNYETVIEDCKRYNLDYRVVYNDSLSEDPESGFREIFSYLELEYSKEVSAFIAYSTQGSNLDWDEASLSPVSTVRDSSSYSSESISNIDDQMKVNISDMYKRFDVCDELRRYNL